MSLLSVERLRKSFGGRPVLRDVDLDVAAGSIMALLGASGCGKTTLLRLVAGFEAAESGRITLDGRVLEDAGLHVPAERRHIGYVPQEGTLFPHLTVAGNVGFGLIRAERRAGRIEQALQLTGLAGLAQRYPHQISGGQQQRTALARALAPGPGLILLDEPFNALDLDLRRSVCADVIATLRQAGATALLVTHDPLEAFASADRLAVMDGGIIVQSGEPDDVYGAPASVAVARLTGEALLLDAVREGDRAVTALGALAIRGPAGAPGPVRALLRPEQLVPVGESEGISTRIVAQQFRGDHRLVTVALGDLTLPVRLATGEPVQIGATLFVAVRGGCRVFPR